MSLKSVFGSTEEIPEKYRDLYTETSPGVWTLTGVEGVRSSGELEELQTKWKQELESAEKVGGVCKKLGIVPEEIESLFSDCSELKKKLEQTDSRYHHTLIASALKDAALQLGIRPEALPDVLARAPLFQVGDNDAVATLPEHGSMSPHAWMEKQIKESPHWLTPSRSAGIRQPSFFRSAGTKNNTMAELISNVWKQPLK